MNQQALAFFFRHLFSSDDIAKKLGSSEGAVHADETYWTLDGDRAYFWVHGDEKFIHCPCDGFETLAFRRNL